ncbi:putative glutamate decarboxylase [Hibiscus syriacus]|uniref:Glutamate decarboxylase n=1 Tax=Hibiscus syriacus TaxID=106335 RepID=A0A6A3CT40_HIBSY|nr:putative glutamate decarboxylase [Hibiscus syriacus]
MNYHFIAAYSLQKVVILASLFLWQAFSKHGSLEWVITLFSLSTLPNTLVMEIPLLKAMYGDFSGEQRFSSTTNSPRLLDPFRVESVVVSLNGREPLQADAEIGDDGKLHVVSSREPSPRASSFNQNDFYAMFASKARSPKHGYTNNFQAQGDVYSLQSSKGATPRTSNLDEEMLKIAKRRGGRSMSGELYNGYPPPNPIFSGSTCGGSKKKESSGAMPNKELHMFVWSSSASPLSEGNLRHAVNNKAASTDFESSKATHQPENAASRVGIALTRASGFDVQVEHSNANNCKWVHSNIIRCWSRNGNAHSWQLALQPKIIACRKSVATFSMAVRFLTGPAVIAATSIAIGLRGVLLHVAIVQAALPQGIAPFVFAKEYNVHPDILSTAVIFGMLIALPITILYYVLLGL